MEPEEPSGSPILFVWPLLHYGTLKMSSYSQEALPCGLIIHHLLSCKPVLLSGKNTYSMCFFCGLIFKYSSGLRPTSGESSRKKKTYKYRPTVPVYQLCMHYYPVLGSNSS